MFRPIYLIRIAIIGACLLIFGIIYILQAPYHFPTDTILRIEKGDSLTTIAHKLKDERMIHSSVALRVVLLSIGAERSIVAGDYYFDTKVSLIELAYRLKTGEYQLTSSKVTIPEGSTVKQIAENIQKGIPSFDTAEFIAKAQSLEGYLFPETYSMYFTITPDEAIDLLTKTFEEKTATIKTKSQNSKHSWKDIVIVASILEREAQKKEDWGIISGILWKRLETGMPLQVDATFYYERGLGSFDLSLDDLRTDSAYNTYTNKGLPPTPIANPGIATLEAALNPIQTPYWYYLTDKKGTMHYAKTHDEHVANKNKYLR